MFPVLHNPVQPMCHQTPTHTSLHTVHTLHRCHAHPAQFRCTTLNPSPRIATLLALSCWWSPPPHASHTSLSPQPNTQHKHSHAQVEGKPELRSSQELQEAYDLPEACLAGALLLVATQDGKTLSAAAGAAAALTTPPSGPRPLPLVGNLMLYMSVRAAERGRGGDCGLWRIVRLGSKGCVCVCVCATLGHPVSSRKQVEAREVEQQQEAGETPGVVGRCCVFCCRCDECWQAHCYSHSSSLCCLSLFTPASHHPHTYLATTTTTTTGPLWCSRLHCRQCVPQHLPARAPGRVGRHHLPLHAQEGHRGGDTGGVCVTSDHL